MRIHILAALVCASGLAAQAPVPEGAPPGLDVIERDGLRKHAEHLASDELGGRYTSTPGQLAAAEYIEAHFQSLGLLPAGEKKKFTQRYPIVRSYLDPKKTKLKVGSKAHPKGFAVVPGKDTKKLGVSGFVFAGYGNPTSFPGKLGRKVPVVVARPRGAGARGLQSSRRDLIKSYQIAKTAERNGAKVVVVCLLENGGLGDALNYDALLPGKPILGYGKDGKEVKRPVPIPIVFTCRALSIEILESLGFDFSQTPPEQWNFELEGKPPTAAGRVDLSVKIDKKAYALNVAARLPGSSGSKEAVVFSAHMDHMGTRLDGDAFNGADDNASGTAGLLEIAEAFAKAETKPRRSVIFLAVSGEELGLWGSQYYSENPTWPLGKIVANVNVDMIGRNGSLAGPGEVTATPSPNHDHFSTLVQDAAGFAAELGLTLKSGDQYYQRSDHYNFAKHGVPVVFFCDGEHADYHQVTDHADKLDFEKMEQIARLAYWTGWAVADGAKKPKTLGQQSGWTR